MSAILATLCLCPSAIPPPGIDVLLQTKGEAAFDSLMTGLSKAIFFAVFGLFLATC
jgi:hypothetical protein